MEKFMKCCVHGCGGVGNSSEGARDYFTNILTNKTRASWTLRRKRIQKSRTSYSEKREEKKTRFMDKVNNIILKNWNSVKLRFEKAFDYNLEKVGIADIQFNGLTDQPTDRHAK